MQTSSLSLPAVAGASGVSVIPAVWRIALLSVVAWLAVCVAQSLATYSDALATGKSPDALPLLVSNLRLYVPWMLFSALYYLLLARTPARLTRLSVFLANLVAGSLLFLVPYELYLVALGMFDQGVPLSEFASRVRAHPAMFVFVDYILFLGCFAFLYALAVFQRTLADERQRRQIEAENLTLRLEAEKNRLAALQAQLEPHFLFNALNALSALVRGGERPLALAAIGQLSELLRYATAASEREWVSIGEELAFVEDYIGLQTLRHGNRLDFRIEGGDAGVLMVECPPLLLQPLVENALRHGLEASTEGRCQICVGFSRDGATLRIVVSNTQPADRAGNPGLGIGLDNLRGRLALVYGTRATLMVDDQGAYFDVVIVLPVDMDE